MPTPTTDQAERARIREALLDLCAERGLTAFDLGDLCARAGFGPAEFERHYADLTDCFCAIYEAERDRIVAAMAAACEGLPLWRDRLRASAYALVRSFGVDPRVTHLTVIDVRSAGERAQLIQWEGVRQMFDLLDEGRAEMENPAAISEATAQTIAGAIFNQLYTAVAKGPLPPEAEVVPQMMYTAVLPYLGSEAALEELRIPPPAPTGG